MYLLKKTQRKLSKSFFHVVSNYDHNIKALDELLTKRVIRAKTKTTKKQQNKTIGCLFSL